MTELKRSVDSTRPAIVVSAYLHLAHALRQFEVRHCISLLGRAEVAQRGWPEFGNRALLRLEFDDVQYSSGDFQAPSAEQIGALIRFVRDWGGRRNLLIHCRAGTARSPAAAMIAAATFPQPDAEVLSRVVQTMSDSKLTFARVAQMIRPKVGCRLLFVYDDLMDDEVMAERVPNPEFICTARMESRRFLVNRDGIASITPRIGFEVHGVIWQVEEIGVTCLDLQLGVPGGVDRFGGLNPNRAGRVIVREVYLFPQREAEAAHPH